MAPSTCYYFSLSSNPRIASKQTGSKTHLFNYVLFAADWRKLFNVLLPPIHCRFLFPSNFYNTFFGVFFLSSLFVHDLWKRMLFMCSLCWGISLKFLCTSLVWGQWVTLALFDDIILLLKPFLLAGWLTSACATEPRHYTLTQPTYWQTHTYCFPLGIFQEAFGLFIPALSQHTHTFPLPPLYFPRRSTSSRDLLDSVCQGFWSHL